MQDGATALHVAAAQGHYEVVLTLVRAFANVNPPAQVPIHVCEYVVMPYSL